VQPRIPRTFAIPLITDARMCTVLRLPSCAAVEEDEALQHVGARDALARFIEAVPEIAPNPDARVSNEQDRQNQQMDHVHERAPDAEFEALVAQMVDENDVVERFACALDDALVPDALFDPWERLLAPRADDGLGPDRRLELDDVSFAQACEAWYDEHGDMGARKDATVEVEDPCFE
jgi:hypothetical protein